MSYMRVNKDQSLTPMGEIVAYRVKYTDPRTKAKKQSKPFTFFWQANQFKQHLQLGSDASVIPMYSGDK